MTATGQALLDAVAAEHGKPYILGKKGPDAWDCSGLTWAALRRCGIAAPHGTINQFPWCKLKGKVITVDEAARIPGAGLFTWVGPGGGGGLGNHVCLSDGYGWTSEARGRKYGVGSWRIGTRFTHGVLWPDVDYSPPLLTREQALQLPPLSPPVTQLPAPTSLEDDMLAIMTAPDRPWYLVVNGIEKREIKHGSEVPLWASLGARVNLDGSPLVVAPEALDAIPNV